MSKIIELENQIQELEGLIKNCRNEIENLKDHKLYLVSSQYDELLIKFKDTLLFNIRSNGDCIFSFSDHHCIKLYEEWVRMGSKISDSSILWKDKHYQLIKGIYENEVYLVNGYEVVDLQRNHKFIQSQDRIFNLTTLTACVNCEDDNIKRFSHNNQPIIF